MKRCSQRKYINIDIGENKLSELLSFSSEINNMQHLVKIHHVIDPNPALSPKFVQFIKGVKHAFSIEIIPNQPRPIQDVYIGFFGELLILKATQLGLGTVWLGADGFVFSSKKIKSILAIPATALCPFLIPFGYPADPTVKMVERRPNVEIAPGWPSSELAILELIQRAPTAMNRQLFTISKKPDGCSIAPDCTDTKSFMSQWLDCGIVATHALLAFGYSTLIVQDDAVVVTK